MHVEDTVGVLFQSTPSAWRETNENQFTGEFLEFQSTPSAWRETSRLLPPEVAQSISIHSLRMEGDEGFRKN